MFLVLHRFHSVAAARAFAHCPVRRRLVRSVLPSIALQPPTVRVEVGACHRQGPRRQSSTACLPAPFWRGGLARPPPSLAGPTAGRLSSWGVCVCVSACMMQVEKTVLSELFTSSAADGQATGTAAGGGRVQGRWGAEEGRTGSRRRRVGSGAEVRLLLRTLAAGSVCLAELGCACAAW